MTPAVASVCFALLILGLFWLDRDRGHGVSAAIWIAVAWWFLACSRSVSQWLLMGTPSRLVETEQALLEGSPIDRLVYSALLALGIIVIIRRRRQVGEILKANWPIVLFFLYCAMSIFWSDYPEVSHKRWTKALGDLTMVLLVLTDRKPFAAFEKLLARVTFLLVPLSVLLIKYYPDLGRMYGRWDYKTYFIGVGLNKNALGAICLLCGVASLWRFLKDYRSNNGVSRNSRLLAQALILTMVLWLFSLANSMTSLSCFLLGSAVLIAGNLRAVVNNPKTMHFIIGTMVLVTISVLFFNANPGVLQTMGKDPTLTDRTEIWALIISLCENPLIGTGYESFWLGPRLQKIWSNYSWQPLEAHNGYLEIFLMLGWIGVTLLAIVLVTGYQNVFAAFIRNPQVGCAMLAYFTVGVVYNFTEAALFRMMTPVWMFFLLAIAGAKVLANDKNQSLVRDPHQNKSRLILA